MMMFSLLGSDRVKCAVYILVSKEPEVTCTFASSAGPKVLELSRPIMKLKFCASSLSCFFPLVAVVFNVIKKK